MNELSQQQSGRPAAYGRHAATVGAVAAAVATGYLLRGPMVGAQQGGGTPITKIPVVQTPATRDAAAMQNAFTEVSKAVEPAVVTITTESTLPRTSRRGNGKTPNAQPFGGDPFGGGDNGGDNGGGNDPFEDFFRQFRKFQPNSYHPNAMERKALQARFYEIQSRSGGLGSGMIYRQDGLILTNAHVVHGADTVTVKLADDREFKNAKVLGIDERTDVAVVKINATNLPTVKLGDSSDVEVGDWAIAVGNPFGLEHTLTVGVISAKAREVPLNERSPGDYLQTDASINPGNSGGPLLDIYGRVIGINNAIYSQSGGNVGIGFAIPINTARSIADRLVTEGRIRRGYLGIKISNIEDRAAALGLDPNIKGVLVEGVTDNTPGGRAGLQEGDVIQSFNGQTVTRSSELQRIVGDAPVNSKAVLKVLRGTQNLTLTATLDELKDDGDDAAAKTPDAPATPDNMNGTATPLGLRVRPLTPDVARNLGIKATHGVAVVGVDDNSAADDAGLQRGDVIERVGQTKVATIEDMQAAVKTILGHQTGDDKSVALYINRNGDRSYVIVHQGK